MNRESIYQVKICNRGYICNKFNSKEMNKVGMPDTLKTKVKSDLLRATDTGVHLALFTNPTNKFYQYTGFVNLGSVYAYSSNTRPYIMYGAHGSSGSVDAGVVYDKEHGVWRVFTWELDLQRILPIWS